MTRFSHPFARRSAFLQYATLAYGAIVVVASLFPFADWHSPDADLLWVQLSEWPRYYTYTDVVLNVLGYIPYGALLTFLFRPRVGAMRAGGLALVASVVTCTLMEILQGGIPTRVPSGLDVFCNSVGGLLGAWLALAFGESALDVHSPLKRWRDTTVPEGEPGDAALVVLALWLLIQFRPDLWLFAIGDVRQWLSGPLSQYSPRWYQTLEAAVAATGLVTLAGVTTAMTLERHASWFLTLAIAGLVVRTVACASFFPEDPVFQWLTPGNLTGVAVGIAVGLLVCRLEERLAAVTALGALLAAVVLVNLAPLNPFLDPPPLQTWHQGHLRSVGGTTQIVAIFWPVTAAALMLVGLRRRDVL
ncbi:MAG: hypothetical protein GC151_00120 [Betaproteobacteria bacterium]|nr:hypothetical protein [Betaproteobacteria bacterium]